MNSLFTCSWQKNVTPINENTWVDTASTLLNEAGPGKRGRAADPRYARLMGLGSVRELAGTMTPRYFATKVIRQLEKDHPGKPIDEISDDDLLSAMNLVSNISRKLSTRPDIKMGTAKVEDLPKSEEKVKKGKDAFETLNLNLDPEVELKFEEDTPAGYGVYTGEKDGLKYRVTLKEFDGKPITVKDLKKDNLASLVVTDPRKKETVEAPTVGDLDAPRVSREKPVADFPAEGEGDFSTPDPEDIAMGKQYEMDEDEGEEDYEEMAEDDLEDGIVGGDGMDVDMGEEDCEGMDIPMKPTIIIVKKSPQALQKEMLEQQRLKRQNNFKHERKNMLGY